MRMACALGDAIEFDYSTSLQRLSLHLTIRHRRFARSRREGSAAEADSVDGPGWIPARAPHPTSTGRSEVLFARPQ